MTSEIGGRHAFVAAAIGLFFGALGPACKPSAGTYCTKVCDCSGCTESERSDCVGSVTDSRGSAEDAGCSKEFDAYFSCISSATTCVSQRIQATGCEAEADALSKCGVSVLLGGDPCAQLTTVIEERFTECGIDSMVNGGEQSECTDELARQARCYLPCYQALECIVLIDPGAPEAQGPTQSFSDCVVKCQ